MIAWMREKTPHCSLPKLCHAVVIIARITLQKLNVQLSVTYGLSYRVIAYRRHMCSEEGGCVVYPSRANQRID